MTSWTQSTFERTYFSKMYRDFMEKCEGGYRVHSHFARISSDDFLSHVTQSRRRGKHPFSPYGLSAR